MLDQDLLKMLVCPETKQGLHLADDGLVARINQEIERGSLTNRGGVKVSEKIGGALVREDLEYFYPVRDEIPIMLIEEAVDFKQFR